MSAPLAADRSFIQCVSGQDEAGVLAGLRGAWERASARDPQVHAEMSFPLVYAAARHRLRGQPWFCHIARDGDEIANALLGVRSRLRLHRGYLPVFEIGTEHASDPLDCSATGKAALAKLVETMMAEQRSCAIIQFPRLRQDAFVALGEIARERGIRHATSTSHDAFVFDTAQSLQAFESGLGRRLSRNLRRERKRLAARWTMDFEALDPDDAARNAMLLDRFIALESAGWKGRKGTAVGCDAWHRDFYASVLELASPPTSLRWYTLAADGRPIAMYLCLRVHATEWALKTAYDEAFATFSPGNELLARIIEHLIAEPRVDRLHMVSGARWLSLWNPIREPHYRLRLFNDTVAGKLAWMAERLRGTTQYGIPTGTGIARSDPAVEHPVHRPAGTDR